jgi:hypothetical protein
MIAPIVAAAAFAAFGAADEVAWSGFDRWSYNSYSELGTKQADYYPEFFKNNVSFIPMPSRRRFPCISVYERYPVPSSMKLSHVQGYICAWFGAVSTLIDCC